MNYDFRIGCSIIFSMKFYLMSLCAFFKRKKFLSTVVLLIVLFFVFGGDKKESDQTHTVARGEFIKSVSVSGKVVATERVDMSFDTSGTVASVYKKVGDQVKKGEVIIALDASELQAERQKAVAKLMSEEAELSKLKSGTNEGAVIQTNKRQVINSIFDAYTNADDAVRNKVDQFYDNGRESNPEIKYTFTNYFDTKTKLNNEREMVEKMLVVWQTDISNLTIDNYDESLLNKAYSNLLAVKHFLDNVSFAVNSFEESNVLTRTMIEKYRGDLATGRSDVNTSMSSLASISDDLRDSVSDIPIYEANVRSARAEVARIDAEIAQTRVLAPFDGILALQDGKKGEAVAQNINIVSVISRDFEIEVFVPEVSIAEINLGNKVSISLDADTENDGIFGEVSHVDPAETEKDGVSNYKVKVKLLSQAESIRPGMTANVTIEKERKTDVIVIPLKFITLDSSQVLVYKNKKEQEERVIVLGEKDGRGGVEVLSGLTEEEVLMLPAVK